MWTCNASIRALCILSLILQSKLLVSSLILVRNLHNGKNIHPNNHCTRLLAIRKDDSSYFSLTTDDTDNIILSENMDSSFTQHVKVPAPIYITVGPPCSGKTEALRSILLSDGYDPDGVFTKDVALSEQSEAYHKIPIAAFLFPSTRLTSAMGESLLRSGSTVKERLLDPSYDATDQEIRNVMLRIAGRLTPQDFATKIRKQAREAGDTVPFFRNRRKAVAEDLILAVEEVHFQAVAEVICQDHFQIPIQQDTHTEPQDEIPYDKEANQTIARVTSQKKTTMEIDYNATQLLSARDLIKTPHVNIFVPQAIFRGGIDRANDAFQSLLRKIPIDQPISWGNTNTRPNEYVATLKAAEKSGRPVKFIAWGCRLPELSRQELLRRNVAQFRKSGNYIPCGAIAASLGRTQKLMKEARLEADMISKLHDTCEGDEYEYFLIDSALAKLAGFNMTSDGFVEQIGLPKF